MTGETSCGQTCSRHVGLLPLQLCFSRDDLVKGSSGEEVVASWSSSRCKDGEKRPIDLSVADGVRQQQHQACQAVGEGPRGS